jgi:hypothetical protein
MIQPTPSAGGAAGGVGNGGGDRLDLRVPIRVDRFDVLLCNATKRSIVLSLDEDSAVEALIKSASLCIFCLAAKSGLSAEDVEVALRVLIRTRSITPAGTCDSCRSAMPAFRGTH